MVGGRIRYGAAMNDTIQRMKQPLPLSMLGAGIALGFLVAFFVFREVDPNAKYSDIQLRKGMSFNELKKQLGEPDTIE